MIYLLGGPPIVGKSIISNQIRQKHALSVVSTDTLAAVLQRVLSPEAAPDLFVFEAFNKIPMAQRVQFITKEPTELVETVKRERRVVWKDSDFSSTGRFLYNYSEWRKEDDRLVQHILFAWSHDLVHWHKFSDEFMFSIDQRYYQRIKEDAHGPWEWPRWWNLCHCATKSRLLWLLDRHPKNALGFGFGESEDGLHWRSLEPPQIEWGDPLEWRCGWGKHLGG